MVWRLSGRKMSLFERFVKMSVLDGTAGWVSGGRLERSRVRIDLREEVVEERLGGEGRGSCCASILVRLS